MQVSFQFQSDSQWYAIMDSEGHMKCSCGRPLNKISKGVWRCSAGYPQYSIDEGDVMIDKYGDVYIKPKAHGRGKRNFT